MKLKLIGVLIGLIACTALAENENEKLFRAFLKYTEWKNAQASGDPEAADRARMELLKAWAYRDKEEGASHTVPVVARVDAEKTVLPRRRCDRGWWKWFARELFSELHLDAKL